MEEVKQNVTNLISTGNTSKALRVLEDSLVESSDFYDDVILIKGSYASLDKLNRNNIISDTDFTREVNSINNSILRVLKELDQEDFSKKDVQDSNVLVFDIDNTLLKKHEDLNFPINENKLNKSVALLLKDLTKKGYKIVFITGNDYRRQKPRVIQPILDLGIASNFICFSDGGSRLFEYNEALNDFDEVDSYSEENEIHEDEVRIVKVEFDRFLNQFILDNEVLLKPKVLPYEHKFSSQAGMFEYSKVIIKPLNKSFFESENYKILQSDIKVLVEEGQVDSQVDFETPRPTTLVVKVTGKHAHPDTIEVISLINDLLHEKRYKNIATPEFLQRGGSYISQLALKPFNSSKLRRQFVDQFKLILQGRSDCNDLEINLGGTTTIDIQRKGVDKAKALRYLINRHKLDPMHMIYFGDEFTVDGNDLPITLMTNSFRPKLIVHVGDEDRTSEKVLKQDGVIMNGKGTKGTLNFLEFLLKL